MIRLTKNKNKIDLFVGLTFVQINPFFFLLPLQAAEAEFKVNVNLITKTKTLYLHYSYVLFR